MCIENSFFKFDSNLYKQTGGVGTGVKLAPPICMFGQVFESNNEHLELIILWKGFIDDVFMLSKGSEEQCRHLVDWLNTVMPGVVKFKYEYSMKKIEFLIENGKLKNQSFCEANQSAIIP